MTDQFQFETDEDGEPDQVEPERSLADRLLADSRDEGYAPVLTESDPDADVDAEHPDTQQTFEERLEPEQPEIEDDWDEGGEDDSAASAGADGAVTIEEEWQS